MKIAHLSDSHIGYIQYGLVERKKDFLLAFEKAVDKCIEMGVDLIIHTGDLFESYQPDMASFSSVIKVFKKIKSSGIEFFAIVGNHDRALRRGVVTPQNVLEELGLLKLLNVSPNAPIEEQVIRDSEILIAGIQYYPKRFLDNIKMEIFPELSSLAVGTKFSIFMFHQGIKQFLPFEESSEMDFGDLPENFDYYAGGHIHAFVEEKVKDGAFSYAGATEFRTRKEAERGNRGFNVIDTEEGKLKRVELEELRPFFVKSLNEENVKEKLEELVEKVQNSHLPPVVIIDYFFERREIEEFNSLLEHLKKSSLFLKINKKRGKTDKELIAATGKSFSSFLEEFLIEKGLGGEELSLAKEVLNSSTEEIFEILKDFTVKRVKSDRIRKFLNGLGS